MNYKPKASRNADLASLKSAIDSILNMEVILPKHRRILLDRTVWAITQVDGKYNLRYVSKRALETKDKSKLRHEHVYPRKFIIDLLIDNPINYSDIIDDYAVACVVTKDEHTKLDNAGDGWKRYERSGVEVYDLNEKIFFYEPNKDVMKIDNEEIWKEFSEFAISENKAYLKGKTRSTKHYNEVTVNGILPKWKWIYFSYRFRLDGPLLIEIYMPNGMNTGIYKKVLSIQSELEKTFYPLELAPRENNARINYYSENDYDFSNPFERKEAFKWFLTNGDKMYKFLGGNSNLFN